MCVYTSAITNFIRRYLFAIHADEVTTRKPILVFLTPIAASSPVRISSNWTHYFTCNLIRSTTILVLIFTQFSWPEHIRYSANKLLIWRAYASIDYRSPTAHASSYRSWIMYNTTRTKISRIYRPRKSYGYAKTNVDLSGRARTSYYEEATKVSCSTLPSFFLSSPCVLLFHNAVYLVGLCARASVRMLALL